MESKDVGLKCLNESGIKDLMNVVISNGSVAIVSYLEADTSKINVYDKKLNTILPINVKNQIIQTKKYNVKGVCDINPTHELFDEKEVLLSVVTNEASTEILKMGISSISNMAEKTYRKSFTRWDKFLNFVYKIFKKSYVKTVKVDSAKDLMNKILAESNKVALNSRMGPARYIICSQKTFSYLASMESLYTKNPADTSFSHLNKVAELGGISVYVDPYMSWEDNRILLGRINMQQNNELAMAFYEDGTSLSYIETLDNKIELMLELNFAIESIGTNSENNYSQLIYKTK